VLDFALFDKHGAYDRMITPNTSHTELLGNEVSFAELVFDDDDAVWSDLTNGSRVRGMWGDDLAIHGPVVSRAGASSSRTSTLRVEDRWRAFRNLGWQNPDRPISSQISDYKRYTGSTETVVKNACRDLSDRLGLGWTIAPDKGLGVDSRVEFRMHPLVDKLVPLLNAQRLTLTLRDGVVDVHQGQTFPRVLTPDDGVLGDYEWKITYPTATRVIVGGEGEGVERLFQQFVDVDRETEWADIVEVVKDSRMAQGVTDLSGDGAEALTEGNAQVSFTADLNENAWFRFGEYAVGDQVSIDAGGIQATEVISRVVIDHTPDQGVVVTPHIGSIEDDVDSRIAQQIARLARARRDQESR